MERFIGASLGLLLLLILSSAAAVEGRMSRVAVFDHHVLIGGDELATACNQVAACACMQIN